MSSHADQPAPDSDCGPRVAARVEQLYECHAPLVRSICGALLRDRTEAEDAVQQTFLSAHRALLNGSSPRDAAAWLATIARHESIARVKARMREPLPVDIEDHEPVAPDAQAAVLGRAEARELGAALAELPPQQRDAIVLRELRGLSYQEVAATLAVTNSAVESLLFRARRSLQARLQGALAALSPGGWVQGLRELRGLGGGGVAAPAVAKAAAVGVGAALFAGGALGPKVLGLGHAPRSAPRVSQPAPHRVVHAARPEAPALVWHAPAHVRPQRVAQRASGGSRAVEHSGAERSFDGSERDTPSAAGNRQDDGSDRSAASGAPSGSSHDSSERDDGSEGSRSETASTQTTSTETTTTGTTSTDPTTTDD
jgi:RNA polymerase sigma-70 factor, ECF subfamily